MRFALALALASVVAAAASAGGRGAVRGIPHDFSPQTVAGVGARDLWVLGYHRCAGRWCLGLVRSTDAGKHFRRVGTPPLEAAAQSTAPTLVFANARDGYSYVDRETALYLTHDGGASWHRAGPAQAVAAFAAAGGFAYVLTARHEFERSPVGGTDWRRLRLPVSKSLRPISLVARGSHVWFLGPPRHRPDFDTIALSSNHGRTFTRRRGPCLWDLGGTLVPAGDEVVWAVCPSGMLAQLAVSTNGGRSFATIGSLHDPGGLREPGLVNSAQIAAASARVSVLSRGAEGAFLRTTDAGRHWRPVAAPGHIQAVFSLAFSTMRVGAAVVQVRNRTQLWRTSDGGATWLPLGIRRIRIAALHALDSEAPR
jgi:photosystem II stability/assembly factor-like uncharacterized protein